jgi:hypothetical protein
VRDLRDAAKVAVDADPTLGLPAGGSIISRSSRNPRRMTVGGADVLAVDLILEIRQ